MAFKDFNISAKTLNYLTNISKNNTFSHAYMFTGENSDECLQLVKELVKAAYCLAEGQEKPCEICLPCQRIAHENHEDVIYLKTEGNVIKISQVEELLKSLKNKPSSADRIAAIIPEADKMNPQSQNKLLKTLEEPSSGYMIILITDRPDKLLETVRSRCVPIHIEKNKDENNNEMIKHAAVLIDKLLNNDAYFDITKYVEGVVSDREECKALLDALESEFSNRLRYSVNEGGVDHDAACGISRIISLINDVRRDLTLNINIKYSLRNLIINISDML